MLPGSLSLNSHRLLSEAEPLEDKKPRSKPRDEGISFNKTRNENEKKTKDSRTGHAAYVLSALAQARGRTWR